MGVTEIVPSTPVEPSAAGIGGVWAKARQGIRPSSARDRIATLLMWRSLNKRALAGSLGMSYFRTTVAKTPSSKIPWPSPACPPGARKSTFADTLLQLPDAQCRQDQPFRACHRSNSGSPGSSDSPSISRGVFRFGCRLGATSEGRRQNVAISAGGFSLQVG